MIMGCLSYFSNWDTLIQLQDCLVPDMDMIIPDTEAFLFQPQPHQQQQPCQEEVPLLGIDHLDPFSDPFLPPQETTFCPNPNTDVFNLTQDLDSFFPPPKRQKIIDPSYHQCNTTLDHLVNSSPYCVHSYLNITSEVSTTFPEFHAGRADDENVCNNAKKPPLSAQSIAARERRRRIAEKTQELGKLIPGGHKLNTAEMFHTAAKYVKFLQAQIGILQLMQSKTSQESSDVEREIRALLASQAMQEKFWSEEVCLVPKKLVQSLATDESLCKSPKMSQDINELMSPDG